VSSVVPLSVLDLARVERADPDASAAIRRSERLAQDADRLGYHRVWFSEHHNMRTIASSATALLIQHVASRTERIRVGAGGIMLPNHSPLLVAEQFGTLEALYPGRIDLGLGRAPGTDGATVRALRRTGGEAERFPSDVLELHGFLGDQSPVPGVRAYPGADSRVPLYMLGSSIFGAQLAAQLGMPYAFASHFAPGLLDQAAQAYRSGFAPDGPLAGPDAKPHLMVALNVIAADDAETAAGLRREAEDASLDAFFGRERPLSDEEVAAVRETPQARQMLRMLDATLAGTEEQVRTGLAGIAARVHADELILVNHAPGEDHMRRTLELLAPDREACPAGRRGA
jgi:luciferase family oxidoreductase group 1